MILYRKLREEYKENGRRKKEGEVKKRVKKERKDKKERTCARGGKELGVRMLSVMVFLRQRHIAPSYVIHY